MSTNVQLGARSPPTIRKKASKQAIGVNDLYIENLTCG